MTDLRQAAEMALEALKETGSYLPVRSGVEREVNEAKLALFQALAQPEQESVREVWCDCGDGIMPNSGAKCGNCIAAESAACEWVPLTDEQIYEHEWWDEETAFAVNKELKEKNGG